MGKKPEKENSKSQENVELELEEEEEDEEEGGEGGEEEEVQKLEEEVKEMAQKILDYRTTLPDQLKSTLVSVLAAQRPVIHTHFDSGSESISGTSSDPHPGIFLGFFCFLWLGFFSSEYKIILFFFLCVFVYRRIKVD